MQTFQHRCKQADLTDTDSDAENMDPAAHPKKKTRKSLAKTSSDNSTNGDFTTLKEIMVASEKRREENQKEMVETLRESTRVYEKTSEKYLDAILQLIKQN